MLLPAPMKPVRTMQSVLLPETRFVVSWKKLGEAPAGKLGVQFQRGFRRACDYDSRSRDGLVRHHRARWPSEYLPKPRQGVLLRRG